MKKLTIVEYVIHEKQAITLYTGKKCSSYFTIDEVFKDFVVYLFNYFIYKWGAFIFKWGIKIDKWIKIVEYTI